MCGIFGAVGPRIDNEIVYRLAMLNRLRGTDSVGFFDSAGHIFKKAGDPIYIIRSWKRRIRRSCAGWFIGGHTRAATRGAVNDANAHPFQYGSVIGAHNGVVTAPTSYDVDSMMLIDKLQGGYEALKDTYGYWGLEWFDGTNFHLACHGGSLAYCQLGQTYYFSSDYKHLEIAVEAKIDMWAVENHLTFQRDGTLTESDEVPAQPKWTGYQSSYYNRADDDNNRRNKWWNKSAKSWKKNEETGKWEECKDDDDAPVKITLPDSTPTNLPDVKLVETWNYKTDRWETAPLGGAHANEQWNNKTQQWEPKPPKTPDHVSTGWVKNEKTGFLEAVDTKPVETGGSEATTLTNEGTVAKRTITGPSINASKHDDSRDRRREWANERRLDTMAFAYRKCDGCNFFFEEDELVKCAESMFCEDCLEDFAEDAVTGGMDQLSDLPAYDECASCHDNFVMAMLMNCPHCGELVCKSCGEESQYCHSCNCIGAKTV